MQLQWGGNMYVVPQKPLNRDPDKGHRGFLGYNNFWGIRPPAGVSSAVNLALRGQGTPDGGLR